MYSYAFLVFLLVAYVSSGPFQWKVCNPAFTYPFNISSVVMVPYPAHAGQTVTIHATGESKVTVTGGSWVLEVTEEGVEIQKLTGNTCDLVPTCKCPCPAGRYTTSTVVSIPSLALSDTYIANTTVYDPQSHILSCIIATFDIVD